MTDAKQFYLLGQMHGHFDIRNLNEDAVSDGEQDALGSINTGLGVVVPVEKIIETMMQPGLSEMRRKTAEKTRKAEGATTDQASDDRPASDAN
jgi:hypothetical protein